MVNRAFHVKQRGLLADAEAGEDLAQHVLDIDTAGDAAQGAGGEAQVLGAELIFPRRQVHELLQVSACTL